MMKCPRCGNTDERWFYLGSRGWYCRKCIRFSRVLVLDEPQDPAGEITVHDVQYDLPFELTPEQTEAAGKILSYAREGKDVLVRAVCGAGKTELVYPLIKERLAQGKKVGFAISRRQVVLQIAKRLARDFKGLKVIPVCEGYTEDTDGDLIVCTTHQLYRYTGMFDALILDEPDAFPFRGNETLQGIAEHASKGTVVYLTATPDEWLEKKIRRQEVVPVDLYRRPSGIPLAVPKVRYLPKVLMPAAVFLYLRKSLRNNRRAILFFPTIRETERYGKWLRKRYRIETVTSKREDKDEAIRNFADGKARYLFATTVMERGVTFSGIDVMVAGAEHPVFGSSSLVQIMGRVGRDPADPEGHGLFLAAGKSGEIKKCVSLIREANRFAFGAEKDLGIRKTF